MPEKTEADTKPGVGSAWPSRSDNHLETGMLNIREERLGPHFLKHHIDLGDGFWCFQHTFSEPDVVAPHSHPWDFTSLVVKGAYLEEIFDPETGATEHVLRQRGDHFDVPASRIHRILDLPEGECKTMVIYHETKHPVFFYEWRDGQAYRRPDPHHGEWEPV